VRDFKEREECSLLYRQIVLGIQEWILRNVEQHAFEKIRNLLDIFSGLKFVSERQWPVMAMVFAHHILFSGVTYFCMLAKK
jgi:hypothetical protein